MRANTYSFNPSESRNTTAKGDEMREWETNKYMSALLLVAEIKELTQHARMYKRVKMSCYE